MALKQTVTHWFRAVKPLRKIEDPDPDPDQSSGTDQSHDDLCSDHDCDHNCDPFYYVPPCVLDPSLPCDRKAILLCLMDHYIYCSQDIQHRTQAAIANIDETLRGVEQRRQERRKRLAAGALACENGRWNYADNQKTDRVNNRKYSTKNGTHTKA